MNVESSTLLTLPLELREIIYKEVLLDPSQGPHILRACREVYSEARKFLYQRPIIFGSQLEFYQWLEHRPEDVLEDIQEFHLQLQDVDLTPILVPASTEYQAERSRSLRTWKLYEEELDALGRSFGRIPTVKSITIRALTGRQTHLYDDFLAKVLHMLGEHFSVLNDLTLAGNMHNQSFDFIPQFEALKRFSFDGFCASNSVETATILSEVNLTRISIVSQPNLLAPTQGRQSSFTLKPQSFDSSVLRTINQLASFSVTERMPTPTSSALFFNPEILGSLHSHKTLSELSLRLSNPPDEDAVDALNDFLAENSSVERLELDWPRMDHAILYILTNRLKSLWIRASSLAAASDILGAVRGSKEGGDAQQLQRVVLIRNEWAAGEGDKYNEGEGQAEPSREEQAGGAPDHADETDENDFAIAKTSLNNLGVLVAWYTERL